MANRGDEVGEALAGAGTRLDEQMVAREHRVLDGTRHRQLAVARLAADPGDREGEQFLDVGNLRCSHGSKGSWHIRFDGGAHPQPVGGTAHIVAGTLRPGPPWAGGQGMGDVLDNEPAQWPRPSRWLVIAVAVAVVVAGVTWRAVAESKPHPTAKPSATPASAPASSPAVPTVSPSPLAAVSPPGPVAASTFVATFSPPPPLPAPTLTGPAPANTGVRLLLTSNAPTAELGIFALDAGAISPVRGFPKGGCQVGEPFRMTGTDKWAVVWEPAENASAPCDSTAVRRLYIVDAATSMANLIGPVEGVVPADGGSLTVTGIEIPPAQQLSSPNMCNG